MVCDEAREALPDEANLLYAGWSLGSGVKGDGIINSITVGLTTYTFQQDQASDGVTLSPVDDGKRTRVEIEEKGWRETAGGLTASYNNCMGWSQMLAALKMWVEHKINLREGAYK